MKLENLSTLFNRISATSDGNLLPVFNARLIYLNNDSDYNLGDILIAELSQTFSQPAKSYFASIHVISESGVYYSLHESMPSNLATIVKHAEECLDNFEEDVSCFSVAISKTQKPENKFHYIFVFN